MFLYLYTLTFNIFMTDIIRIPSPIVFALPLVFLFKQPKEFTFGYTRELFVFLISAILLYLFAQQDIKNFFVFMIIASCCSLYFNYFVGNDIKRLKLSVWMFYLLLVLSSIVMLLNHLYPEQIIVLRSILVGEIVRQTP